MSNKSKKTTGKPDKSSLSERQRRILDVITDAVMLRGYPPSIREIGDAAGLQSTSSVAYQLKQLEEKGFLRRDPNKPRAVDVRSFNDDTGTGKRSTSKASRKNSGSKESDSAAGFDPRLDSSAESSAVSYIPVVGQIAAGSPITAEENIDTFFPMPVDVVGSGELYMLQVVGESMKDAGILDGDWVIIHSQDTAEEGDFVAALLNGDEATVKELHRDSSGVWLLPHNDDFEPINGNDAKIMGKVVSVFRKL
ncbi:ArsR family transcriptional regulator [Corynebacterium phocae]|uniref:LexA repressor n=1 Tax=Corynebacterium phocae TaxID=161895 RepID=A0A1L7D376_9CORY|nr:transcriptional repressor LexA [Corynebacterium phocae]APT92382.1 ArsR family transcriptional regulator [Corynebacterium phocae]KAA8724974.1 transcriptional repressor LexA [Corynebacterium phocae]